MEGFRGARHGNGSGKWYLTALATVCLTTPSGALGPQSTRHSRYSMYLGRVSSRHHPATARRMCSISLPKPPDLGVSIHHESLILLPKIPGLEKEGKRAEDVQILFFSV